MYVYTVCIYVACIYMCMYVCMYVCIHCMYVYSTTPQVRIYVCIRVYVCMYICMHTLYVCILNDALSSYLCHKYIHIYINIYIYTVYLYMFMSVYMCTVVCFWENKFSLTFFSSLQHVFTTQRTPHGRNGRTTPSLSTFRRAK